MTPESIEAVQDALAAEHAVIWGYGAVGAAVSDELRSVVVMVEATHRSRRDATADLLRAAGAEPVVAQASYELPFAISTQEAAVQLGEQLESGCAASWRHVLGRTDEAELRRTARDHLIDAAVQAMRWLQTAGVTPASVAFPGQ